MNEFLNKLDIIFSRKAFMIMLCIECLIKNVEAFKYGKFAIYFICVYSVLLLFYRLIFKHEMLFRKDLILGYLFIISAIIPCIIYKFQGLYNDIVMIVIFVVMFLIVSNFNFDENVEKVKKEFLHINSFICISYFVYTLFSVVLSIVLKNESIFGLINKTDFYAYNCLTIVGCSLLGYFESINKKHKVFYIFNIILHVVTIFFTQSRATYLGFFASVIIICIIDFKDIKLYITSRFIPKKVLAIFMFCVFLLFIVLFFTELSITAILNKIKNAGLSGREYIWIFGLCVFIKENLLFGLSYGGLPIMWDSYIYMFNKLFSIDNNFENFIIGLIKRGYAHSIYLQQLFSHGLFGFLLLLIFIINIIINFSKSLYNKNINKKILYSFIFVVFGQLVTGAFNNNIFFNIVYISQVMFFYYIGYLKFNLKHQY